MTDRFSFPLELKASTDAAGTFRGYGSTFGGPPDAYGDVITAGAFAQSLAEHKAAGTAPALLWAHDTQQPIGRWIALNEDRNGLAVEGKLTLDVVRAREAHALMKDGALGLSIGYRVKSGGTAYQGDARILKAIDLVEISAVAIPANPAARVTGVKSAAIPRPENIRDFEAALRDACGFSVREAKRIASAGWPALMRRDDASEELNQIAALLRRTAADFQTQR